MLRITTTETETQQTWILQGQLAGPWVAELRASWNASLKRKKYVVDLTDVTFVDESGVSVLRAMQDAGVKFIACGVDTKDVLEGLKRKTVPPLRRCLSWLASDACRKDETEKR